MISLLILLLLLLCATKWNNNARIYLNGEPARQSRTIFVPIDVIFVIFIHLVNGLLMLIFLFFLLQENAWILEFNLLWLWMEKVMGLTDCCWKCFDVVPYAHKQIYRRSSSSRIFCLDPWKIRPSEYGTVLPPLALCRFPVNNFPRRVQSFPSKLWIAPRWVAVYSPVEPVSSKNLAKTHAIVDCLFDKLDTIVSTWFTCT